MSSDSSKCDNLESILHDPSSKPDVVPLRYLRKITNNFSDELVLGKGGTGVVYKGVLENGEVIAVKRIAPSMVRAQSLFENEVHHLTRLKHPNIVRFIGYCYETKRLYTEFEGKMVFAESSEMLLCLEYLPKGSLDGYLSDGSSDLDWHMRYKIIEGICNGLHYLHEQIDKSVLHLDLKPANVLLDDNLAPKITDFGLSRLIDQHQTISSPNRVGTFGYMAPEYIHEGTITPKSDIFSLGVIIMELIVGHKNYPDVAGTSSEGFIELELKKWRNTLQKAHGYTKLEVHCQQIKGCIQIGLICINPEWTKRPTTTVIIEMLQGLKSSGCSISSEATSSAYQSSKGLKKHKDYFGVTEEGKLSPKNTTCIEIFGQAERRDPQVGEASVSLAMSGDCQRGKLLYLKNRVALASILFPIETKVAMNIAQVDDTLEFTLGSSANPHAGIQRPTIDLNITPLARIRALSKTGCRDHEYTTPSQSRSDTPQRAGADNQEDDLEDETTSAAHMEDEQVEDNMTLQDYQARSAHMFKPRKGKFKRFTRDDYVTKRKKMIVWDEASRRSAAMWRMRDIEDDDDSKDDAEEEEEVSELAVAKKIAPRRGRGPRTRGTLVIKSRRNALF